jgi:hypothetical protein
MIISLAFCIINKNATEGEQLLSISNTCRHCEHWFVQITIIDYISITFWHVTTILYIYISKENFFFLPGDSALDWPLLNRNGINIST